MNKLQHIDEEVIDLGEASIETKGDAIFQSDGSGGKLQYVTGMTDD